MGKSSRERQGTTLTTPVVVHKLCPQQNQLPFAAQGPQLRRPSGRHLRRLRGSRPRGAQLRQLRESLPCESPKRFSLTAVHTALHMQQHTN